MEFISFMDKQYPLFQSLGNASQFSIPYAKHYCKGVGYDIGFCKEEWKFPGAIGIDLSLDKNVIINNIYIGVGIRIYTTFHFILNLFY